MRKQILSIVTVIFALIFSFDLAAQVAIKSKSAKSTDTEHKIELNREAVENMSKTPLFAMGVSSKRRLQSALMMYHTLKNNEVKFEKYEILVWGKVVNELRAGSEWHEKFKEVLEDERLSVSVCGFAMKKLEVDERELIPGLKVVPDAFSRVYELQALDYNVLIP